EGENVIIRKSGEYEVLNLNDVLESWDPLSSEPLSERIDFFKNLAHDSDTSNLTLSKFAISVIDFWKNLIPDLVPNYSRTYEVTSGSIHTFEIQVSQHGLFFKDINGQHGFPPKTYEQIFS